MYLQIHEEARKFSYQTGVKVVVAYGGAPIVQQVSVLDLDVFHLLLRHAIIPFLLNKNRVLARLYVCPTMELKILVFRVILNWDTLS